MPRLALAAFVAALITSAARNARADGQPRVELSPASLSFDAPGDTRTVLVRNVGDAPLHLGAISFVVAGGRGNSDFRVDAPGAPVVAAGEATAINVSYRPVGFLGRPAFAALLIPADDPRLPPDLGGPRHLATVALRARETHLLSAIVFLPLLGALLVLGLAARPRAARGVALAASAAPLALAALALARFDPTATVSDGGFGVQLVAHHLLVRALDLEYFVGVDGLSIAFVILAPLLGLVAVLTAPRERAGLAARLALQGGASGVFVALDGFLLWMFWLVAIAGAAALVTTPLDEPRRGPPAYAHLAALFAGAAILLVAMGAARAHSSPAYLCDGTPSAHTLDLLALANTNAGASLVGHGFGSFWALAAAFVMTASLFPFHGWAAAFAPRAPAGAAGLVTSALPALAIYGFLRLALPLAPAAALSGAPALAALAAVGALFAALLARETTDVRRLLALAGSARVAIVLLGLAHATSAGLSGALAQAVASALAATLVFVVADAVLEPGATLADVAGLAARTPRAAGALVFAALASVGAPGLATFVGPSLVAADAFDGRAVVAFAAVIVLAAWAIVAGVHARVVVRAFVEEPSSVDAADLDRRTLVIALGFGVLLVVIGLAPATLLDLSATAIRDLVRLLASARD